MRLRRSSAASTPWETNALEQSLVEATRPSPQTTIAPKKKTKAVGSKVSVKALLEAIGEEVDIRAVTNTLSSLLLLDPSQRSGLRDVHKVS